MNEVLNMIREELYNMWKYVRKPEKLVCDICSYDNYRFAFLFPDRLFLKCIFKKYMKARLHISNPVTFSEKIQWLKLYDRNPEYCKMADKEAVKQYVADKIGDQYIIPTIGVFDSVEKVPFGELPPNYVIKCTHDSGSTFVCNEKFEFNLY